MRRYFVDTFYWIALTNQYDDWHRQVVTFSQSLDGCHLYTVDEVLSEFLTFFSAKGSYLRKLAAQTVRDLLDDPQVTVLMQSRDSFLEALTLYESRLDKEYSLTDCVSILTMRREGIINVLSHDHHFEQEGLHREFRS